MPYTPVATDPTEPVDGEKASILGLEFRTLKGYIQSVLLPLINGKVGSGGGNFTGTLVGNASGPAYISREADTASLTGLQTQNSSGTRFLDLFTLGVTYSGSYAGAVSGDSILNANSGNLVFATNDTRRAWIDHAGVAHFTQTVDASISGSAANAAIAGSATNVLWSGVLGRPTSLSAFTNDVGYLTSVAWGSVSGRPTNLSQFVNDLAGSGILSLNGRSASAATIISSDISGALGYTPYNAANPSNFTTLSAVAAAGYQTSAGSVSAATTAYNVTNPNSNGYGLRTVSTGAPSGGNDGDVWYQVSS